MRSVILALALAGLAGCGKSESQQPMTDAGVPLDSGSSDAPAADTPPAGTGGLRFMNAAPFAGPLDVYVDGRDTPIFTSITYGLTSGQIQVPAGTFRLALRPAGTPSITTPIYRSADLVLAADGATTAVAAGQATDSPQTNTFRVLEFPDAFAAAAPGKTRVRVVDADYSQQTVAIDIGNDGSLEIPSLARFTSSSPAGIEVSANTDLAFSTRLTDAAHTRIASFVVPGSLLGDGTDVNIVLIGLQSVPAREALGVAAVIVPAPGKGTAQRVRPDPVLYLLSTSPDAGNLDGYLGTTKRFSNAGFGAIASSSVPATATGHTLSYRAAGADPSSLPLGSFTTPRLDVGQQYLVVLSGLVAGASNPDDALAQRVYRDDMSSTVAVAGRMRAVHAGVGVTPIDVGRYVTAGGTFAWQDVAGFSSISRGDTSPAEGTVMVNDSNALVSLNPTVRAAEAPTTFLRFGTVSAIPAGQRWFGVFAGAWAPTDSQVPPRYIIVKASNSAPWTWTTTILSPQ